jgi:hypothetical protein
MDKWRFHSTDSLQTIGSRENPLEVSTLFEVAGYDEMVIYISPRWRIYFNCGNRQKISIYTTYYYGMNLGLEYKKHRFSVWMLTEWAEIKYITAKKKHNVLVTKILKQAQ